MATDTTAPGYWLNWRFLLCAIWITAAMIFSALVIWKYEGRNHLGEDRRKKGSSWATCSESINPIWLLAFRIVAFCTLLALILADIILHGVGIMYFYTQWTFTLVTIYFGIGSTLSILGCLRCCFQVETKGDHSIVADAELGEDAEWPTSKTSLNDSNGPTPATASVCEYLFQIIFQVVFSSSFAFPHLFSLEEVALLPISDKKTCAIMLVFIVSFSFYHVLQMCAGAVVLTDIVYWLVLYPFYADGDDNLTFLVVCMHSVNAVFLLGDAILNSLSFPFFRVAYFVLWTCIFVVFQWIIHACVSMSWPYAFLDLSSQYSPLWYLGVGLMHIPCYGVFSLIFKIKRRCLSR